MSSVSARRSKEKQAEFDFDAIPPDCCAVPLTNGGYALVDEEDLCRVDEHNWYKVYRKSCRTWYAYTYMYPGGKKQSVAMHRHLFGLYEGDRVVVDHKNHNGLDNRRSKNLRLASRAQNLANSRKIKEDVSSRYRGVMWISSKGKWHACTSAKVGGVTRKFNFGYYAIEEEAAFAYIVGAPLLRDPDYLRVEPIPDDRLPGIARQAEIKAAVIARVKARFAGQKGLLDATSQLRGVGYIPRDEAWRAQIKVGSILYYLGLYHTELEAAYAYNCGVSILKLAGRKANPVSEPDIASPDRAEEIRAEVAARIEASRTGRKVGKGTSSRYRGVSRRKDSLWWKSTVSINKRIIPLAFFATEIEAAVAYNIAASILNNPRLKPNPIPPEEMPSPDVIETIRLKVTSRLASIPINPSD